MGWRGRRELHLVGSGRPGARSHPLPRQPTQARPASHRPALALRNPQPRPSTRAPHHGSGNSSLNKLQRGPGHGRIGRGRSQSSGGEVRHGPAGPSGSGDGRGGGRAAAAGSGVVAGGLRKRARVGRRGASGDKGEAKALEAPHTKGNVRARFAARLRAGLSQRETTGRALGSRGKRRGRARPTNCQKASVAPARLPSRPSHRGKPGVEMSPGPR